MCIFTFLTLFSLMLKHSHHLLPIPVLHQSSSPHPHLNAGFSIVAISGFLWIWKTLHLKGEMSTRAKGGFAPACLPINVGAAPTLMGRQAGRCKYTFCPKMTCFTFSASCSVPWKILLNRQYSASRLTSLLHGLSFESYLTGNLFYSLLNIPIM